MCACVSVSESVCSSENNLQESVLSFHYVDPAVTFKIGLAAGDFIHRDISLVPCLFLC